MLRFECSALGLLMFLLGGGVGAVLTYVPFCFHAAKLRRKLEKLQPRECR
jgi:hypothetical protein